MGKSYNWGILGPGKIADKFTEGLKLLPNARLYAVGSRSSERAVKFAELHRFVKSYGSYEELAADPLVDIVYIASPHSYHLEHTLLCLENGKNVICEKAFSLNSDEVGRMITKAGEKNLFLMEALWPPFQPSYRAASEILESGAVGEVLYLRSHFAFIAPYNPLSRLYNPELGGGALLDIGIYPVIDALTFMGMPSTIEASAAFTPEGIDQTININFTYGNGRYASLYASLNNPGGIGTELFCSKGKISLLRTRDLTQVCRVEKDGEEPEIYTYKPDAMGYHLEAAGVMQSIDDGQVQSSVVPWSFSRDLMAILDKIRLRINLAYPGNR